MIKLLMMKVDIHVEQHKVTKEELILILLGLLLTLRQIKLTLAHRCFATLRKHKRHSRVPNHHKIHGGQKYPIHPFLERIYPIGSIQYNRVFLANPHIPAIGKKATFGPNLVLQSKLSASDTLEKLWPVLTNQEDQMFEQNHSAFGVWWLILLHGLWFRNGEAKHIRQSVPNNSQCLYCVLFV